LVFLHNRETPISLVTELLESTFGYTRSWAMRTAITIDAHGESVVAVVEKTQADDIVASILSRVREAVIRSSAGCPRSSEVPVCTSVHSRYFSLASLVGVPRDILERPTIEAGLLGHFQNALGDDVLLDLVRASCNGGRRC